MEETKSFEGAALATTFLMNGLITMLVPEAFLSRATVKGFSTQH